MQVKWVDEYQVLLSKVLGNGSFGTVYKALHEETLLAVKIIPKFKIEDIKYIKAQIQNMKCLVSPHVLKLVDFKETANNIYIFTEYCNFSNLRKLLQVKKPMCEMQARRLMAQLINGYNTLYQKSILHRDLKPQNILINEGVLKIGDFGLSKQAGKQGVLNTTQVGSPMYKAPQLLRHQSYNYGIDVWSLGVIYFQMILGRFPFKSMNIQQLYNEIKYQAPVSIPESLFLSGESRTLLSKMLNKDPKARASWDQVKSHVLFRAEGLQEQMKAFARESEILKRIQKCAERLGIRHEISEFLSSIGATNQDRIKLATKMAEAFPPFTLEEFAFLLDRITPLEDICAFDLYQYFQYYGCDCGHTISKKKSSVEVEVKEQKELGQFANQYVKMLQKAIDNDFLKIDLFLNSHGLIVYDKFMEMLLSLQGVTQQLAILVYEFFDPEFKGHVSLTQFQKILLTRAGPLVKRKSIQGNQYKATFYELPKKK